MRKFLVMMIEKIRFGFKDFKNHKWPIMGFILFGFFVTALAMGYYILMYRITLDSEILNQKTRAKVLVQKIENYTAISDQLSRTLQNHFNNSKYSQHDIEKFLTESVRSGPSSLIYGVGLWFKPYGFQKSKKLFGPYAHRLLNEPDKINLTYEWNTETYNYPEQDWYKKGLLDPENGVYVEPYFDTGLVYVSYVHAFFDSKKKISGVISVDMILPQLQKITDELNKKMDTDSDIDRFQQGGHKEEVIYIESRGGYLLSHPEKDKFFEKINNKKNKSLIDFKISDLKNTLYLPKENQREVLTYFEVIPRLDWKVVVETKKDFIFRSFLRLNKSIFIVLTFFWICLFASVVFFVNATNIKNASDKMNADQKALLMNASKLATLGEFSSGIAHEINNPLAIVYGKTELLIGKIERKTIQFPEIIAELKKICVNADRIAQIIRGLKTFSRDGKSDPFIKTPLKDIFADTFSISSERIKLKNIQFEIFEFADVIIDCRPTQISQVLLNLLNNAIDAIDNQPKAWIHIRVLVGEDIQILITDSGSGIPVKIAEKIMDPFFTTKVVGNGTGLGLSISYGIIKEHKGVLVYNADHPNTQFIVRLPRSI